jgi:predicted nucleic acid-binding protein
MNRRFADSLYFIAVLMPKDQWHNVALRVDPFKNASSVVTSEEVLIEVLNFFSEYGPTLRKKVALFVREILLDPRFQIAVRDEAAFLNALGLYESRLDKGYSLTDCISMNVCRDLNINQILTHDNHFTQEGFNILL